MTLATMVSGISTIFAALVAGWFAWLARRASAHGPESVAGGYSKLVNDMRTQQTRLMQRVEQLEAERRDDRRRIDLLLRQVAWLMDHVPAEQQLRFADLFRNADDAHIEDDE